MDYEESLISAVETILADYPNFQDFSYINDHHSGRVFDSPQSKFYASNHSRSSSNNFDAGSYPSDLSQLQQQQTSGQFRSSSNGNLKLFQGPLLGNLNLLQDPMTTVGMGSSSGDVSNWLQPTNEKLGQQLNMNSFQYSQTGMNSSNTELSSWSTLENEQVRDHGPHTVQQQRHQTFNNMGWSPTQYPNRKVIPASPSGSVVMGSFSQGFHPLQGQSQQPQLQEEMKSFSTSHSDNSLSVASTEGGDIQRGEHRRRMSISSRLDVSQLSGVTPTQHHNEFLTQEGDVAGSNLNVSMALGDFESNLAASGRKSSPRQIPMQQQQLVSEFVHTRTGSCDGSHTAESAIVSSSPSRRTTNEFRNSPPRDRASSPTQAAPPLQQLVPGQAVTDEYFNQQDRGLLLVNLLVSCADAVANNKHGQAMSLLNELSQMVSPHGDSIQRVASYFTYGLLAHIAYNGSGSISNRTLQIKEPTAADALDALQVFSSVCPFMRFGEVAAIQTILEAFEGEHDVHWIDIGMVPGSLWLSCQLLEALAARKGGPPKMVHFTGVQVNVSTTDDQTGRQLKDFAENLNLNFIFQPVSIERLEYLKPWMLTNRPGQAVAVNCSARLHTVLYDDGACLSQVLAIIHSLSPKVFCILEQEATHNVPTFLARFLEALHFYSAIFDTLEATLTRVSQERAKIEQLLLGQAIINIVAREGKDRVERHERLEHWRSRLATAGYRQQPLSEMAVAQVKSLRSISSETGFTVIEDRGSLILNWQDRPLFTSSAWCT